MHVGSFCRCKRPTPSHDDLVAPPDFREVPRISLPRSRMHRGSHRLSSPVKSPVLRTVITIRASIKKLIKASGVHPKYLTP